MLSKRRPRRSTRASTRRRGGCSTRSRAIREPAPGAAPPSTRAALYTRTPPVAGLFARALVAATVSTGQGQVGAGAARAGWGFQVGQRAALFAGCAGWQTTRRRPLLNMPDGAHAGKTLARMYI